ncbi:MAG: glycosyltransferase family 4 protein [candidate division Zixibacteria bacterium]|nr:glycosyltransferase family 4 protein [candidate division Zixibacteria bacterium]
MKRIKVLRIITRQNIGGPAFHTILLTSHLDHNRFESILVKGSEGKDEGDMDELAKSKKIELIYVKELSREISLRKDLIALWKLYRIIRREKPDIVHTHTAKAGTLGRFAARLAGVPIVVHTFHGNIFEGYFSSLKSKLFLNIERLLASLSSKVIAISHSQKQALLKYKICNPGRISCIPLGLELEPFLNSEKKKGIFRKELNLDEGIPLIGIVARLVPIKGHIYFLEAAKLVSQDFPSAKFIVVGDGELRKKLMDLVTDLGIKDKVIFCGFRKNLTDIYADLDIVVLSSLNEGLPVSIIEALTAKKAVVATEVGGVRDLVENRVTGILVPKQDSKNLAQGMLYLLRNPQEGLKFGENGRKKVYPALNYTRLVSDIEELYEDLVAKRGLSRF